MGAETSIPCSKDTLEVVKAAKKYDGQPYDELLQRTFGTDDDEP